MTMKVAVLVAFLATEFCSSAALAQRPTLTLTPDASRPTAIFSVEFSPDDSVTVWGSSGNRVDRWTVGPREDFSDFGGNFSDVRAAERLNGKDASDSYVITASPLQAFVWDLKRQKRIREIKTSSLDGFPLACRDGGVCAWEEASGGTRTIRLQDVINDATLRDLSLDNDSPMQLLFSPNAGLIAAGVNRAAVRLWSPLDGREKPPLALEPVTMPSSGVVADRPRISFLLRDASAASALCFSPDSRFLAVANDAAIHVFAVQPGEVRLLRGFGRISALAFDKTGKFLFFSGSDHILRAWNLQAGTVEVGQIGDLETDASFIAIRADGAVAAVALANGKVQLLDISGRKLLATIELLSAGQGWIALAPNGMFETSEGAWRYAAWHLPQAPNAVIPIERFYKGFYAPGLIATVLRGAPVPTPAELGTIDIRVPSLKLEVAGRTPPAATLIPGQGIVQTPEKITFRIEARPGSPGNVVRDLELTHNGTVISKWPGVLELADGVASVQVELQMFPGDNTVSAFAFNAVGVRSAEEKWERKMQGWGYVVPQRTLYVIDIGIGTYPNSAYRLDFAERDADLVEQAMSVPGQTLQAERAQLSTYVNERSLSLLQATRMEEMPARIVVTKLVDARATRAAILTAIRTVVAQAGVNDAFLLYYSGHGIATRTNYFLLPFDMGLTGPIESGRAQAAAAAPTLLSDDDLETALLPLNVSYAAIVLDACESGAAIEGSDLRGPLDREGLAGLAYEKGIYLLAAAEAQHPATELQELKNSVLTYALFREGLQQQKADLNPMDGRIDLKELLSYASERVSKLFGAYSAQESVQQARFAPKWQPETTVLVLSTAAKQP